MFIGHFGPAAWDTQRGQGVPIVALWQGFLAVQAIDILWAILVIFGVEGTTVNAAGEPLFNINWSHSLLTSVIIAVICGFLFSKLKPEAGQRGFWIIAALVFSHWVLDLIVHRPDLPLYPGGELLLGFGFWNYPIAAFILEAGLLAAGLYYWQRVTRAKSKAYDIAIWVLFLVMTAIHYYAIVMPRLAVQAGTFDHGAGPKGAALGISTLILFFGFAFLISRIERGRPSKFAAD